MLRNAKMLYLESILKKNLTTETKKTNSLYPNVHSTDAVGGIYSVYPNNEECYYLRFLLLNVRGPTSFQHLRTVIGEICGPYRESNQRLLLLENNHHRE